jgi:hypothetical protein
MAVKVELSVEEYIWLKVFPKEEMNYDDFYDWSRENASIALDLALEYCNNKDKKSFVYCKETNSYKEF